MTGNVAWNTRNSRGTAMKNNPRRKTTLLAAIVLMTAAAVILIIHLICGGAGNTSRVETATKPFTSAPVKNAGTRPEAAARVTSVKAPRADVLRTNEDIRRKYGRIETVTLSSGKTCTGAVVSSTTEVYSIVTVGGMMKVPMRDVKMRVIIR